MKKGDIVGIYENYTGGQRLTSGRIKSDRHKSDYAIEYKGLVRDAWDPVLQKPCHHLGYGNDSLDINRDNMTLPKHPDCPKLLLMILTRDVHADEQGFVPYGGLFFCDDKYPLDVLIKAVRRYEIDVSSSTEDTSGNWRGLALYGELLAACPPRRVIDNVTKRKERLSTMPAENNHKKQRGLEKVFLCPPAKSLMAVDAVEMAVADDPEPEEGRSAAAGIAVELRDSAACMMLCDDDVAPVDFSTYVRCVLDRKARVRVQTVI